MTNDKTNWVAQAAQSRFPLTALPYGIIEGPTGPQVATRLGPYALGLADCFSAGLVNVQEINQASLSSDKLNALLAHPKPILQKLRKAIITLVSNKDQENNISRLLNDLASVQTRCPIAPGDFIDFYSSYHHAVRSMTAAGAKDPEPPKNWFSMPVGYHSRTSTIIGSNLEVTRPRGQLIGRKGPKLSPSYCLDFEFELGLVTCGPETAGQHITPDTFEDHAFGVVLLNDWSARDFQAWEAQPLGPLLSKSFATQLGDWVMPLEAFQSARIKTPSQETALPYLRHEAPWGLDINLTAAIETEAMRRTGEAPETITQTNAKHLYWNIAQYVSHATVNGSGIRPGDLFGTGTISGPDITASGCLLERTNAGRNPLQLKSGQTRHWVEDGDRIIFDGEFNGPNGETISLGGLSGLVTQNANN